jgi:hypothetical protein
MRKGGSSTAAIVSESGNGTAVATLESPPHQEEVDAKLDQAREQLLALRRQQEELERQKGDLEELRRKQDEYARGKTEMIEQLTRALVTLDREHIQSQRLAELCATTTGAFRDFLEQLQAINDEEWTSANVRTELSHALGTIENARCEFNRARAKLECLDPNAAQPATPTLTPPVGIDWPELFRYARLGAAASAPLILAGTIWVILLLVLKR